MLKKKKEEIGLESYTEFFPKKNDAEGEYVEKIDEVLVPNSPSNDCTIAGTFSSITK